MLDSDFGSDSQKPKYFLGRHKFTLAYFLKNKTEHYKTMNYT